MKYAQTWNSSDTDMEGPGWVDNTQDNEPSQWKVVGDGVTCKRLTSHPREKEWLLQAGRAPSRLCHYEAIILQPRQHFLQAWFLSRTFLAPSCSDPVASTPQPL